MANIDAILAAAAIRTAFRERSDMRFPSPSGLPVWLVVTEGDPDPSAFSTKMRAEAHLAALTRAGKVARIVRVVVQR
jgi:hypothetical protein